MMKGSKKKLAIVGAGMASCGLVKALADAPVQVDIFDKARGVGGRMSNMRTENGPVELGAQFMTAHQVPFCEQLLQWYQQQLIVPANALPLLGSIQAPAWIAQQSFSAAHRQRLKHSKLHLATRVTQICLDEGKLYTQVADDSEATHAAEEPSWGPYDHIVISAPAPQALALLTEVQPTFMPLTKVNYWPIWVLIARSQQPLPRYLEYVDDFRWIESKSTTAPESVDTATNPLIMIQMSPQWSEQRVNQEAAEIATLIQQRTADIGLHGLTPVRCHRWLYGLPRTGLTQPFLTSQNLSYIGDVCSNTTGSEETGLGHHIELAFMSGYRFGQYWLQRHALST